MNPSTILGLLQAGVDQASALAAAGSEPLTYAALRSQIERSVTDFNRLGVGRNDRVAIVLPNGREMATTFLCVACCSTAAPLNPGYKREEFDFYLRDLQAKVLVVDSGSQSVALEAAADLGIPVIDIQAAPEEGPGAFRLAPRGTPEHQVPPEKPGPAESTDVALILHTSGTTSRPKIVPLTQSNLTASARNVAATLALSPEDRGLNVMPLFHIHGLVAALLAPLSAGGSVYCTPGFNALRFFGWMEEARATWYTAVSTMHQAILTRAHQNRDLIARQPLRFIRSSSASLPVAAIHEIEAAFKSPLIEAYGMTEAAHQMTSNPLPPKERKPGTVGVGAGAEVAIMDTDGNLLATGTTGEVVIRGEGVTPGYENNPEGECGGFHQRLVQDGRPGVSRRRGVPDADGTAEGDHQSRGERRCRRGRWMSC
jgi:acyl-CoA synthetase (AMP-forming)/AMP-acid ligase II